MDEWPVAEPGPDGAYVDCPCLNNDHPNTLAKCYLERRFEIDGQIRVRRHDSNLSVPVHYGVDQCSSWDSGGDTYSTCRLLNRPDWCSQKWCYVDAQSCSRKHTSSVAFPGFTYSYATCGYAGSFSLVAIDRPVYVFVPNGQTASINPSFVVRDSRINDAMLHYAGLLLSEMGIRDEHIRYRKELSKATMAQFPSLYTGCVHDIAIGHLDFCLGDFWDTGERRAMDVPFSGSVTYEGIYMVGRSERLQDWDFFTQMAVPFRPFSWDLWSLILVMLILAGISMALFEYHYDKSDFSHSGSIFRSVIKSIYLALSSFANAGVAYSAVTPSGRIVALGYALFILICIASFTANLASDLIRGEYKATRIRSIEDALNARKRICYVDTIAGPLEQRFPRLVSLGSPLLSATHFLENFTTAYEDGSCEYGIMGEHQVEILWASDRLCDVVLIGGQLLLFPLGFYGSHYVAPWMHRGVAKMRLDNAWEKVDKSWPRATSCANANAAPMRLLSEVGTGSREHFRGRRRLRSGNVVSEEHAEPTEHVQQQFTPDDMWGACVLFFTILVLAFMVRAGEWIYNGRLGKTDLEIMAEVRIEARKLTDFRKQRAEDHCLYESVSRILTHLERHTSLIKECIKPAEAETDNKESVPARGEVGIAQRLTAKGSVTL